jgi:Flp pilus assembly protein TadD
MAEKRGQPADIALVAESFGQWLLQHGETERAGAVIGRVASWAAHDYNCAVLQVAIYHALHQTGPWRSALEQAKSLAGDRKIPAALLDAPVE